MLTDSIYRNSIKVKLVALIVIALIPLTILQGLSIKRYYNESIEAQMNANKRHKERHKGTVLLCSN